MIIQRIAGALARRVYHILRKAVKKFVRRLRPSMEVLKWFMSGKPAPPPHAVKVWTVRGYAKRFGTPTLIETGTCMGHMLDAVKGAFNQIFSVELSDELWQRAARKFADVRNIQLLHGDSAEVLPGVISSLRGPCLFWLDAHYSAGGTARGDVETPIVQEINHILTQEDLEPVILVDDARHFIGANDYPTLAFLKDLVQSQRPGWVFQVRDDIIRIHRPLR